MKSAIAATSLASLGAQATFEQVEACFENFTPDTNQVLAEFFASQQARFEHIGPAVTRTMGQVADFVLGGGKRIRPRFAWAGYLSALSLPEEHRRTPAAPAAVLRSVAALELIQACALIHDDIIDASDLRRGNPTVHRINERLHTESGLQGDSAHFGASIGILAGDLAHVWADDMFAESEIDFQILQRALIHWQQMRTEVTSGQILDIALEAAGINSLDPTYLAQVQQQTHSVNLYKTAAYTIARPLQIGAAFGGGSPELIAALGEYGKHVGLGFQLRDDLLGVFGDPAITGKPAGDDLREGKVTELILTTLELLSDQPALAEQVRSSLGKVTSTAEIEQLCTIITESGAVAAIEEQIANHRTQALEIVAAQPIGQLEPMLEQLALKATARDT